MANTIHAYLDTLTISPKQSYKNLTVYPLESDHSVKLDYLTLDEAMAEELIDIVEVTEGGEVPELKVVNKSSKMVLIIEGEVLVGAKQNRVVNTTILVQADSTVVIPVSCVEQGRWSYSSDKFSSSRHHMAPSMRTRKAFHVKQSLERNGSYRADQSDIWEEISAKAQRLQSESPTMSMNRMYEDKSTSLQDFFEHFKLEAKHVGAVFAINDEIVGLDSFGKPETYAGVYEKLLNSYALDAIDWLNVKEGSGTLKKQDVETFLESIKNIQPDEHKPVQLGTDYRLESGRLIGFALSFEKDILHLSVFNKRDRMGNRPGMRRFSQRMRNRM